MILITNNTNLHSHQWTACIRDLGVLIDTKFHFRLQVDNIFSQAGRLMGLIHAVTFSCSSPHSLLTLQSYCTSVRPKLQYVSVAWNSVTSADALKLERIHRQFVSLCYHRFISHQHYSYGNVMNCLKFHTLIARRLQLVVLFLTDVFMFRNVIVTFWKLLACVCRIEILETLVCLLLTLNVEYVFLQNALRRQMASAVMPIYSMDVRSWLMIGQNLVILLPDS